MTAAPGRVAFVKFFRSLARAFWGVVRPAAGETTPKAAPPKNARSYRSPFSGAAAGDGFDGRGTRPVDLTGGVKLTFEPPEEVAGPPPPAQSDFVASLDDLGLLIDEPRAEAPPPESAPPAPAALDFFEDPAPVDEPMDSFEPAPIAAEPVLAGEQIAPAPEAVAAAPAQFTVDLLMPVGREVAARPRAVEAFSTLELLDTIEQLTDVEGAPAALAPATPEEPAEPGDQPALETPES